MKKMLLLTLVVFLACTFSVFAGEEDEVEGEAAVAEGALEFVLIANTNPGDEFWQTQMEGMNDAAKAFGVKATMQFANNDLATQVDMVEAAIASEVDGIAVVISDADAFDKPMQKAIDAGIAVMTFNVDDPEGRAGNPRLATVGQNLFEAGVLVGETIAQIKPKRKHVACFVEIPGATYAVLRYGGIKQALDAAGISNELVDVGYESQASVLAKMEAYLEGHPETDHTATVGSFTADIVGTALDEMGLVGKVTNGGFDISKIVVEDIKNGTTVFACDQQPYSQGFYAVVFLWNYIVNGQIPADYNTGMAIINADNVDQFEAQY
jgi:simple sugar transport system substrate-binding protein